MKPINLIAIALSVVNTAPSLAESQGGWIGPVLTVQGKDLDYYAFKRDEKTWFRMTSKITHPDYLTSKTPIEANEKFCLGTADVKGLRYNGRLLSGKDTLMCRLDNLDATSCSEASVEQCLGDTSVEHDRDYDKLINASQARISPPSPTRPEVPAPQSCGITGRWDITTNNAQGTIFVTQDNGKTRHLGSYNVSLNQGTLERLTGEAPSNAIFSSVMSEYKAVLLSSQNGTDVYSLKIPGGHLPGQVDTETGMTLTVSSCEQDKTFTRFQLQILKNGRTTQGNVRINYLPRLK